MAPTLKFLQYYFLALLLLKIVQGGGQGTRILLNGGDASETPHQLPLYHHHYHPHYSLKKMPLFSSWNGFHFRLFVIIANTV